MTSPVIGERPPEEIGEGEELVSLFDNEGEDTTNSSTSPEDALAEAAAAATDELPEKYRGKTQAELVAMLTEQERFIGQRSNEIGELRRQVDNVIQAQANLAQQQAQAPAAQPASEEEEVDFFDDPSKAVDQRIASHPSVKDAQAAAEEYRRMTAQTQLQNKHPDMFEIVQDETFLKWVQESPMRVMMLQNADKNFDTAAADELFTVWKERKQMAQTAVEADKSSRNSAVQAASTGAEAAPSSPAPVKKYRRADIIELMTSDPDRYLRLQPEIMKAYAEKRVID
jgi:hypothetical protein